jgi:hypothetical protein
MNDDSYDYILDLLYSDNGIPKEPSKYDDLYRTIQNIVLIYQKNPDWPDEMKQDMMQYVQKCTNLLEKM